MRSFIKSATLFCASLSVLILPSRVSASTINWTDWTTAIVGTPGSASGTVNGIGVTYIGEVDSNTVINGTTPDWSNPASSFIGGTVDNSPSSVGDIITLTGATGTNTLTFASALVNPVFAIWSLGAPGSAASFTFNLAPTFEAGGSDVYGGGPITVSGDVVNGVEGSGVVQFTGTITSISWTDTTEFYYGFTVGEASTPEPGTIALLGAGIAGLAMMRRFRKSS
jgi:hypothetical protein